MTLSISEILFNHISLKVFALRKHLYLKGQKMETNKTDYND